MYKTKHHSRAQFSTMGEDDGEPCRPLCLGGGVEPLRGVGAEVEGGDGESRRRVWGRTRTRTRGGTTTGSASTRRARGGTPSRTRTSATRAASCPGPGRLVKVLAVQTPSFFYDSFAVTAASPRLDSLDGPSAVALHLLLRRHGRVSRAPRRPRRPQHRHPSPTPSSSRPRLPGRAPRLQVRRARRDHPRRRDPHRQDAHPPHAQRPAQRPTQVSEDPRALRKFSSVYFDSRVLRGDVQLS